jgi:hypothetical protein
MLIWKKKQYKDCIKAGRGEKTNENKEVWTMTIQLSQKEKMLLEDQKVMRKFASRSTNLTPSKPKTPS